MLATLFSQVDHTGPSCSAVAWRLILSVSQMDPSQAYQVLQAIELQYVELDFHS